MLIVWWTLWLYPVTAMAPDLATCNRKWVRMTDRNYQRAIKHYADCVLLGQALDPPTRELFQSNIVINLQKTCDYFFQRTSLPTSGLIGVVREVAKILEGFEETATVSGKIHNNLSWSTAKGQCNVSLSPFDDRKCPKPTRPPYKCKDSSQTTSSESDKASCSQTAMYFMLLLFLLLLLLQIIFIIWFCCCNNCICLEMCRSERFCACGSEDTVGRDESPVTEVYHMTEIQQDLASLSSENIGSDSEFEALLKMTRLPKAKRQWHSKEAD
ncbi:unnamed protein product [Nezara viridula]|uniref:Neuropeptide n=1 Tax=Nezara viridula TaxID=85310 RepID=A0A9P0MXU8_NEZVI|nr:unnamed protein product [Nezara viridula]